MTAAPEQRIAYNLGLWTSAIQVKAATGRSRSKKYELYGIKKLRELILEIAFRGLLLPQDANDEPAEELLKNIDAEKTSSVKAGKARRLKKLPELEDHEKGFELPDGWQWVRFGDVAQHNAGKTLDRGRNSGELRDYLTTSNLYWGRFDLTEIRRMRIRENELGKCTARRGDLLICEGGEAGRAAVWDKSQDICFQNHIHRVRFFGQINPHFAQRYFEWLSATGEIENFRRGVGISNMSGKALASIPFILAPLSMQDRIVSKVDELMTLCDTLEQKTEASKAAHETLVESMLKVLTNAENHARFQNAWERIAQHFDTLFINDHSVDQLKKTILSLAVMGRLVPQDEDGEAASELLYQIKAVKAELFKGGKIRKQKALPPIEDQEKPYPLPANWEYAYMQDLCMLITDGTHQTPKYVDEGRPFVSAQCVKPFHFMPERCRFVSEADYQGYIKNRKPELGDILLVRVGAGIGEAALIDKDLEFAIYVSTGLLKPYRDFVLPEYLVIWLNSPEGRRCSEVNTLGKGVSQGNLNLSLIRSFMVSVPPVAEQQRIVSKVDEINTLLDQLKLQLKQAQKTQLLLAEAIVEEAITR